MSVYANHVIGLTFIARASVADVRNRAETPLNYARLLNFLFYKIPERQNRSRPPKHRAYIHREHRKTNKEATEFLTTR